MEASINKSQDKAGELSHSVHLRSIKKVTTKKKALKCLRVYVLYREWFLHLAGSLAVPSLHLPLCMTSQPPSLGLSSPVHGDQGSLLASFPLQTLLELKPALSQQGLWPTCPVAMVLAAQWTATATVTKDPWPVSQA